MGADVDCDGESSTNPAKPVEDLESVPVSAIADVVEEDFVSASPFHVDVGPDPIVHPDGLLQVGLPETSGRLRANPSSFDCAGVRLGEVNAVPPLTYEFDDLSTDDAVESAAIQTCSRCAASGLNV